MSTLEEDEKDFLEKLNLLKKSATKLYGPRCDDYYPACICCIVWKCIEDLEVLIRST